MKSVVIIPTYNEKDNIQILIEKILEQHLGLDILVVDDNSPDGTGIIAEEFSDKYKEVQVIKRLKKEGLGSAYIHAFKYCLRQDSDIIITMDADLSHDPIYIKDLLREIKENDMVVGSRYLNGVNVVNWPLRRLLLSIFANRYVKIITGLPISDCTSGFNCFKRDILESINLNNIHSQGYAFLVEIKYRAFIKGFRIKEVPIVFTERRQGETKMSNKVIREAVITPWRLRLNKVFLDGGYFGKI